MTTIAYKDGVIAYDSRETMPNGTIKTNNCNKRFTVGERHFFLSGKSDECEMLAHGWPSPSGSHIDCGGFLVDGGRVFLCGMDRDRGTTFKLLLDHHWAVGSGGDHAITAMDLGLSALEAVRMAVKRDAFTGGRIRTYKVKQ